MTSFAKRPKKKLPLALKRVRKEIPPPSKTFKEKKRYSRKRAKDDLRRSLKNSSTRR